MDPPTTPHMIRHGRKAKSTGVTRTNAGLCIVNETYVKAIVAIITDENNIIFFFPLIFELHNISFYISNISK